MAAMCAVYCIRNMVNGLIYVGGSIDVAMRWREHRNKLKRGKNPARRLQADFWALGLDAFQFEILETVESPDDLRAVEQSYIDRLRPFDPAIGYNTHTDAQSPTGVKRSIEARRRIAKALTGQPFTQARRANIAAARRSSPKAQTAITELNRAKRALTEADVLRIVALRGDGLSAQKVADQAGVSRRVVRAILDGETYTEITGLRPKPAP